MSKCIYPRCQADFPYCDGVKFCTVLEDCYDHELGPVSDVQVSPQPGT